MLPINGDLDFNNNPGILNLGEATANGQPVIWQQLQALYTYINSLPQNTVYTPMVYDGFNTNIVYVGEPNMPNFVTMLDGNFMYIELSSGQINI